MRPAVITDEERGKVIAIIEQLDRDDARFLVQLYARYSLTCAQLAARCCELESRASHPVPEVHVN